MPEPEVAQPTMNATIEVPVLKAARELLGKLMLAQLTPQDRIASAHVDFALTNAISRAEAEAEARRAETQRTIDEVRAGTPIEEIRPVDEPPEEES